MCPYLQTWSEHYTNGIIEFSRNTRWSSIATEELLCKTTSGVCACVCSSKKSNLWLTEFFFFFNAQIPDN